MNYLKAILCGVLLWICVAVTFFILEHTPIIKDSVSIQTIISCVLIVFYAAIAASFYYKKQNTLSGISLGVIMSLTALIFDILLFVPLVEIPKGNTYQDFFTNPLLWVLTLLNITTVYCYWKKRIKISAPKLK